MLTHAVGSISAVSRVRSLILPEERVLAHFPEQRAGNRAYPRRRARLAKLSLHLLENFDFQVQSVD